ncbi:MAG TPA: hypothetical protein VMM36_11195, partial [Opitutaceae bacterium]|nr:hypothetical protein [Opitutaceae bacterium]
MAVSENRRQKKLVKQAAKKKAAAKAMARIQGGGLATRIARLAKAPILHSGAPDYLWKNDQGLGIALISRKLADGQVAFAKFLLDVYCLGVKNAHVSIVSYPVYRDHIYLPIFEKMAVETRPPAYVRKLVEGAVDYARRLGFEPHPDYRAAREIFGDIDPN